MDRTCGARIPLQEPSLTGKELEYVSRAIESKKLGGDGAFTRACSTFLETRLGIERVLMTPSCTAALELAAMLCELGPGDEVLLPSFTFVSTANAIVRMGARPVFVDIRSDTLNLDEFALARAVTRSSRAVIPVHYAGVGCAMDHILTTAAFHSLYVIEDAAQAVNGYFGGRALGSIGQLGAFSFHETKNFTCGEGGALCVNSPEMLDRAEIMREKGTDRSRFLRGEVSKYTWVDVGSSYVLGELSSALLLAQLEAMEAITDRRRVLDRRYRELLAPLEEQGLVRLPCVPEGCESNFHNFFIILSDSTVRDALMAHLRGAGIDAAFHFVPLHTSPMGRRFGYRPGDLPVTEEMSSRLLRLPFSAELTLDQQATVVRHVSAFLRGASASESLDDMALLSFVPEEAVP